MTFCFFRGDLLAFRNYSQLKSPWLKKYLIQQTVRQAFIFILWSMHLYAHYCRLYYVSLFCKNAMWFGNREQMHVSYMPNVVSSHCVIVFGEPDMPLMCFLSLCTPTKGEKTQFLSLPFVPLKSNRFLNFKMSMSYFFFFPFAAFIYCFLLHVCFSSASHHSAVRVVPNSP